ncbi:dual specificity protein phosphatase 22 [Arapaima gigas]
MQGYPQFQKGCQLIRISRGDSPKTPNPEDLVTERVTNTRFVASLLLHRHRHSLEWDDAKDREQLARYNITHILSIHDNATPLLQEMTYLCISAADLPTQNLTQHFKASISFIHESRLKGEGCLVHCLAAKRGYGLRCVLLAFIVSYVSGEKSDAV